MAVNRLPAENTMELFDFDRKCCILSTWTWR